MGALSFSGRSRASGNPYSRGGGYGSPLSRGRRGLRRTTRTSPDRANASHGGANDDARLRVQFLEIAVDAPLAERDAPRRGEIGCNARPLGHAIVQRDDARHLALEPLHPFWKGVTQTFDNLEQRKVDIGELATQNIGPAALLQHALEIAQEFRQAMAPEVFGGELGCRALLFVIEIAGDRMMRAVNQHDEIGDGEL